MICKYCKVDKPMDLFPIAGVIKGKTYLRRKCKTCYVAMKTRRRLNIKKEIIEYKKKLNCKICNIADYRVIEFHHPNDDKEHNISDMLKEGMSLDNIMKEIDKCDPLCANCHRILHYKN